MTEPKPLNWTELLTNSRELFNLVADEVQQLLTPTTAAPAAQQPAGGPEAPIDAARREVANLRPAWDTWATGFDAGYRAAQDAQAERTDAPEVGADRPVAPQNGEMNTRPDLSWMLTDEAAQLFRDAWNLADSRKLTGMRTNHALAAVHDELAHRLDKDPT